MNPINPSNSDILEAIQSHALDTDQRFSEIQDQIATSHDEIIGRLERVEQELTFTNAAIQRHEIQLSRTR